jgi:O-antigen ligase/tetratricopeptide (TPR) repeat protein
MDATPRTHQSTKTNLLHESAQDEHATTAERVSRWGIDAALATCVFVVPCLLGGRIALGQFVLAASAACAVLSWSVGALFGRRPTCTITRVELLLLAAIGLGLWQITPLPASLLRVLSPQQAELLPLWRGDANTSGTLGQWQTLSLNVGETRLALITGLSYVALFWVATQRLRQVRDIERLLKWIGLAAGIMALLGVVQWLAGNGKFFGIYEYPLTTSGHRLKGAFTNRNHFAQFLVLGCAPLFWWILRILEQRESAGHQFGRGTARNNADAILGGLIVLLSVLVFSVLFSLSRGGMVALSAALFVLLLALFHVGRLTGRMVAVMAGIGLITGSLFAMFGYDKVVDRMDNWKSDERLAVWQANWQILQDFPWFGTGLGSHAEALPLYFDPPFVEVEFTHAENSYLQIASESGLCGFVLALLAVAICAVWCGRALRSRADVRIRVLAAVVSASLAGNVLHAGVDFIWFVPGLMVITLLLAACARRLDQLAAHRVTSAAPGSTELNTSRPPGTLLPRGLALAAVGLVAICAVWSLPQLTQLVQSEPHWFEYLRLALAPKGASSPDQATANSSEQSGIEQLEDFKQRLSALTATVKLNPSHARAHARLAASYLAAFEHLQLHSDDPMSLSQLRDAALASRFETLDAQNEWLNRAVGKNLRYLFAASRHARRAVELCPLQGQAYVALSELRFLEDRDSQTVSALLHQAQLVRPRSAAVQFAVGQHLWLNGRIDEALAAWKIAFHQDSTYQDQILALLVGNVPAASVLEHLQPDLAALKQLEARYNASPLPRSEYAVVAEAYAEALQQQLNDPNCDEPVEQLIAAAAVYQRLQADDQAAACLQRALDIDRSSFAARKAYGVFLYQHQEFAEAAKLLGWCSRIAPNDRSLRTLAEDALSRSLRTPTGVQPASFDTPASARRQQ